MPTFDQGNSLRWRIFDAVATALETAPELQAVPVFRDSAQAVPLESGDYRVVLRWDSDRRNSGNAVYESRQFQLSVASIASTAQSDRDADAMHQVVAEVLRGLMPNLNALTGAKELAITEQDVAPNLDGVMVEGAMVLSVFEITYRSPAYSLQMRT